MTSNNRVLQQLSLPCLIPTGLQLALSRTAKLPAELAALDIMNDVTKKKPDLFLGFYFDVYRGEREEFEALLTNCIKTWYGLNNDNLVPLLGISMAFGSFPAMITSWMSNGTHWPALKLPLTEYMKSGEDYNKMQLIVGVGNGVEYLHSQNIIHSDIQAASVLVDELSVVEKGPLADAGSNAEYRWMAPELLSNQDAKTTFATDVYAFTMTSWIWMKAAHFADVSEALVPRLILQNQRPSRPAYVEDTLWTLWNEGWNQDFMERPNMKSYFSCLVGISMAY
ncbi:hypothetical protein M422DRAFT_257138 [Sphaerobolus stellatus SS14]|uniref:Protein kinase domain-containing protein n=1 Tax=Sphaerobolus stellatus (strain SS14) TaxID=990650 RepID=A0A0C9VPJ4_SPHS4|nr:hypothetical protein M422DRAFT_257138 [Sphaerobolus stellatus SS14]